MTKLCDVQQTQIPLAKDFGSHLFPPDISLFGFPHKKMTTVKNISTGKTVTHTFSNEASLGSLCEYNAEWIVEDFDENGSEVTFADFSGL
jgi:hypothetical protein